MERLHGGVRQRGDVGAVQEGGRQEGGAQAVEERWRKQGAGERVRRPEEGDGRGQQDYEVPREPSLFPLQQPEHRMHKEAGGRRV